MFRRREGDTSSSSDSSDSLDAYFQPSTTIPSNSSRRPESGSRSRPESAGRSRPESGGRSRPDSAARSRPQSGKRSPSAAALTSSGHPPVAPTSHRPSLDSTENAAAAKRAAEDRELGIDDDAESKKGQKKKNKGNKKKANKKPKQHGGVGTSRANVAAADSGASSSVLLAPSTQHNVVAQQSPELGPESLSSSGAAVVPPSSRIGLQSTTAHTNTATTTTTTSTKSRLARRPLSSQQAKVDNDSSSLSSSDSSTTTSLSSTTDTDDGPHHRVVHSGATGGGAASRTTKRPTGSSRPSAVAARPRGAQHHRSSTDRIVKVLSDTELMTTSPEDAEKGRQLLSDNVADAAPPPCLAVSAPSPSPTPNTGGPSSNMYDDDDDFEPEEDQVSSKPKSPNSVPKRDATTLKAVTVASQPAAAVSAQQYSVSPRPPLATTPKQSTAPSYPPDFSNDIPNEQPPTLPFDSQEELVRRIQAASLSSSSPIVAVPPTPPPMMAHPHGGAASSSPTTTTTRNYGEGYRHMQPPSVSPTSSSEVSSDRSPRGELHPTILAKTPVAAGVTAVTAAHAQPADGSYDEDNDFEVEDDEAISNAAQPTLAVELEETNNRIGAAPGSSLVVPPAEDAKYDDEVFEDTSSAAPSIDSTALEEVRRLKRDARRASDIQAEQDEEERRQQLYRETLEVERIQAERTMAARIESERIEAECAEAARIEAQRLEAERLEAARIEAERVQAEAADAEELQKASQFIGNRLLAKRAARAKPTPPAVTEDNTIARAEALRQEEVLAAARKLEEDRIEAARIDTERAEAERVQLEAAEAEELQKASQFIGNRLLAKRAARAKPTQSESSVLKPNETETTNNDTAAAGVETIHHEGTQPTATKLEEQVEAERLEAARIEAARVQAEAEAEELQKASQFIGNRLLAKRAARAKPIPPVDEEAAAKKLEEDRIEAARVVTERAEAERAQAEAADAEELQKASQFIGSRLLANRAVRIKAVQSEKQRTEDSISRVEEEEADATEPSERSHAQAEAAAEDENPEERRRAQRSAAKLAGVERARALQDASDQLEAERIEAQRIDAQRREAERQEAERIEAERIDAQRREAERIEAARIEAERIEAACIEAERIVADRIEAERIEAERIEAERLEAEREALLRLNAEATATPIKVDAAPAHVAAHAMTHEQNDDDNKTKSSNVAADTTITTVGSEEEVVAVVGLSAEEEERRRYQLLRWMNSIDMDEVADRRGLVSDEKKARSVLEKPIRVEMDRLIKQWRHQRDVQKRRERDAKSEQEALKKKEADAAAKKKREADGINASREARKRLAASKQQQQQGPSSPDRPCSQLDDIQELNMSGVRQSTTDYNVASGAMKSFANDDTVAVDTTTVDGSFYSAAATSPSRRAAFQRRDNEFFDALQISSDTLCCSVTELRSKTRALIPDARYRHTATRCQPPSSDRRGGTSVIIVGGNVGRLGPSNTAAVFLSQHQRLKRLATSGDTAPLLAGHTCTLFKDFLVIVGGASPETLASTEGDGRTPALPSIPQVLLSTATMQYTHVESSYTMRRWASSVHPLTRGTAYHPNAVTRHSACLLGTTAPAIFVFGGIPHAGAENDDVAAAITTTKLPPTNALSVLHLPALEWEDASASLAGRILPAPRHSHTALAFYSGSGGGENTASNTTAAAGTDMVIFGGQGVLKLPLDDVWVFSLDTRAFEEMRCGGDVPCGRYGHAAEIMAANVSSSGFMLVHGGVNAGGELLNDMFSLCLSTFLWREVVHFSTPPAPVLRAEPPEGSKIAGRAYHSLTFLTSETHQQQQVDAAGGNDTQEGEQESNVDHSSTTSSTTNTFLIFGGYGTLAGGVSPTTTTSDHNPPSSVANKKIALSSLQVVHVAPFSTLCDAYHRDAPARRNEAIARLNQQRLESAAAQPFATEEDEANYRRYLLKKKVEHSLMPGLFETLDSTMLLTSSNRPATAAVVAPRRPNSAVHEGHLQQTFHRLYSGPSRTSVKLAEAQQAASTLITRQQQRPSSAGGGTSKPTSRTYSASELDAIATSIYRRQVAHKKDAQKALMAKHDPRANVPKVALSYQELTQFCDRQTKSGQRYNNRTERLRAAVYQTRPSSPEGGRQRFANNDDEKASVTRLYHHKDCYCGGKGGSSKCQGEHSRIAYMEAQHRAHSPPAVVLSRDEMQEAIKALSAGQKRDRSPT
ncbi:Hypothetical protein, putative [Bodo saltans]|uniref:Uncharacterized protein n=1 Tax=Bodo saltans TaxID=75058 RepID=A0A0S4J585_BODSA|nr:Hypothetical protein, putative [Bodo saltans]|eukprot:CUG86639.1 Hypothetical protein, putative [Bodo saltans]